MSPSWHPHTTATQQLFKTGGKWVVADPASSSASSAAAVPRSMSQGRRGDRPVRGNPRFDSAQVPGLTMTQEKRAKNADEMTPTSPSLMPKSAQNKTTPSKPTATQKTPTTKKPATLKTAVTAAATTPWAEKSPSRKTGGAMEGLNSLVTCQQRR